MKAQIAQGGIFLILIITTIIVAYIIGGAEPVSRNVITIEGSLISFENYEGLLIKTFDASIEFISQRAAYDLGSTGGIEGKDVATWSSTYPSIDLLRQQLENKIKENLPQGTTQYDRTVSWGDASINVSNYDDTTFEVDGNKSFSIYDKSIDSRISLDPYNFSQTISSNYFKLLNAGRTIMEDSRFNTKFNDAEALLSALNAAKASDPRFANLNFSITPILTTPVDEAFRSLGDINGDGIIGLGDNTLFALAYKSKPGDPKWNPDADLNKDGIVDDLDLQILTSNYKKTFPGINIFEITIEEKCYPPNTYCLAPLKPGEVGEIAGVPYDYLKLKFKVNTSS